MTTAAGPVVRGAWWHCGMELLLAFAVVLFAGVLLSGLAHRTILSTAVLFLFAGLLLGDGATGVLDLHPDDELVVMGCALTGQ